MDKDTVNCNDVIRVEVKVNGHIVHIHEKVCNTQNDLVTLFHHIHGIHIHRNSLFQMSRLAASLEERKEQKNG